MEMRRWQFVGKLDHSFWFFDGDQSRTAIADESADDGQSMGTPPETDDGTLWLDTRYPIVREVYEDGYVNYHVPVVDDDGERGYTISSQQEAEWLCQRFKWLLRCNSRLYCPWYNEFWTSLKNNGKPGDWAEYTPTTVDVMGESCDQKRARQVSGLAVSGGGDG